MNKSETGGRKKFQYLNTTPKESGSQRKVTDSTGSTSRETSMK
jgi:hypothetical protein